MINGRVGWIIILVFAFLWNTATVIAGENTLTGAFRRHVTDTRWRIPALVFCVLLLVHLFLPADLRRYDPIDRFYRWLSTR